jgi:UDP-N-acetylglucosamine--N-acetylmuramyl-(pentapeptide) pyrophosphoryl-undecaprenol N-acetylglucosamine transferase
MGGRYGPYEWATFDDAQSRSLLRGERVHYVDYIAPRGYAAAAKDLPAAVAVLLSGRYGAVVSTGSGIALPFFIAARALRVPSYYIESAARVEGPSATGRLLRLLPGTRLFTQYPALADRRWAYGVLSSMASAWRCRRSCRRPTGASSGWS